MPTFKVYHRCEDPSVIGSMFYLMKNCDGNVYWNPGIARANISGKSKVLASMVAAAPQIEVLDAVSVSGLANKAFHEAGPVAVC